MASFFLEKAAVQSQVGQKKAAPARARLMRPTYTARQLWECEHVMGHDWWTRGAQRVGSEVSSPMEWETGERRRRSTG